MVGVVMGNICHGATSRPWLSGVRQKKIEKHYGGMDRVTHNPCQSLGILVSPNDAELAQIM
jgi:hypothetical protein